MHNNVIHFKKKPFSLSQFNINYIKVLGILPSIK